MVTPQQTVTDNLSKHYIQDHQIRMLPNYYDLLRQCIISMWWEESALKALLYTLGDFVKDQCCHLVQPNKCIIIINVDILTPSWSSKLQENNEQKNTLVALICVLSDAIITFIKFIIFEWELASFSKTTLIQREPLLTILLLNHGNKLWGLIYHLPLSGVQNTMDPFTIL